MAKVKGKFRAGNIMIGRRVYPLAPMKKGEVLNLPAIRANEFNVEGVLVSNPNAAVGSAERPALDAFRLDSKYTRKHTRV